MDGSQNCAHTRFAPIDLPFALSICAPVASSISVTSVSMDDVAILAPACQTN